MDTMSQLPRMDLSSLSELFYPARPAGLAEDGTPVSTTPSARTELVPTGSTVSVGIESD